MKLHTPLLALAAFVLAQGAYAINENARNCDECQSRCHGQIITFNKDNGRSLSKNVKDYMEKATSIGAKPESCIRPQFCQNDLLACYHKHGCDGRAAKKSKHTDGTACDWKSQYRGTLNGIIHKFPNIIAWHHGNEGGGIHDFTNNYKPSDGNLAVGGEETPQKVAKPATPQKQTPQQGDRPATPDQRQPATSGAYEQFPSGRYKCPRGMQSICGSTSDTRWCKQWLKNGHTAGCY